MIYLHFWYFLKHQETVGNRREWCRGSRKRWDRGRTEALLFHVYNYVVRSAGQELFRRYVVGIFLDVPHVGRHE